MDIKVNIKQIGERRQKIAPVVFRYEHAPRTLRELITQTVDICVKAYNERVRAGENSPAPLSESDVSDMATVGKIAFGINYGGKEQDARIAEENALQAFEDGLYRVFLDDAELERLDEETALSEDSSLTFIRLTMLAGRMW